MAVTKIWDIQATEKSKSILGVIENVIDYAANPEKTAAENAVEQDSMLDIMEYAMQDAKSRGILEDVIDYAIDDFKTEKQFYVTGVNCSERDAASRMALTKERWHKDGGILLFHGYQSFKPGELTPETAHEIGVKTAQRMWGERFEVVVSTHLNTGVLHNHFVLNSVSFADGKKYYDNKANYALLRRTSDELCREYALSVVDAPNARRGEHYYDWQAHNEGKATWRQRIRQDVDTAIKESATFDEFIAYLKGHGYAVKTDVKHIAVRPKGKERYVRLRSLDASGKYDEDALRKRFEEKAERKQRAYNSRYAASERSPKRRKKQFAGRWRIFWPHRMTVKSVRIMYASFLRTLAPQRHEYAQWDTDAIRQLRSYDARVRFMNRSKLDSTESILGYKAAADREIDVLSDRIKVVKRELKNAFGGESDYERLSAEIKDASARIKKLRYEVRMCGEILDEAQKIKKYKTEVNANEHNRRRGRTNRRSRD